MYGIDISEHQGYWPPERFEGWAFAIIRARNEHGNNDRRFWDHWRSAEGRTLRGVYGWPIAGWGTSRNFDAGAALVNDFPGSEFGYWADVERSGRGLASIPEVEAYCQGIQSAGGHAGFYSNIGELPRSDYLDGLPWWVADYGPNDGNYHDPAEQPPYPPRPWAIHQFTSAGGLDRNYAPSGDLFPKAKPPRKRKDTDMYVALTRGLDGLPYAYLVSGHVILGEFPAEPRGFLAIPQAAIDYAGDNIPIKNLADIPGAFENLSRASRNTLNPPTPPPPPDPVPSPASCNSTTPTTVTASTQLIPPPSIDQVLRHAAAFRRWSKARASIRRDLALRNG